MGRRSLSLALFAVVALVLAGTSVASAAADGGLAVQAYEWNNAVAGSPPGGMPCGAIAGATVCWEAGGDRWWVQDTASDGRSAVSDWLNYVNGAVHRTGGCRNGLGAGTWGFCNKDYIENSTLLFRECRNEGASPNFTACSGVYSTVRA